MRVRWYAWVLALVPVAVGIWSLQTGDGDFRSSGFMSGLGVTLGLVAVLLLFSKPWTRVDRASGWLSIVGAGLLGGAAILKAHDPGTSGAYRANVVMGGTGIGLVTVGSGLATVGSPS